MHSVTLLFFFFFLLFCFSFCVKCRFVLYGLGEGTDPRVLYTQPTKLLKLIALLGIILFCSTLVFMFLIVFFYLMKNVVRLMLPWHNRLYRWTPHISAAPWLLLQLGLDLCWWTSKLHYYWTETHLKDSYFDSYSVKSWIWAVVPPETCLLAWPGVASEHVRVANQLFNVCQKSIR